jgi:hypothetical protein
MSDLAISSPALRWQPGDQALLRYRRRGPVSFAYPVTVVQDGPDHTALFLRAGTPIKRRVMPDGTPFARRLPYAEAVQIPLRVGDGTWGANHALILFRDQDAFDVRLFWGEDNWAFRGWYVNLQRPVVRVPTGFDTADHVLDIWVEPDGRWSWKDEDEMATAVEIARFTADEAAAIRAEGERVIAVIAARCWPFDASLVDWRPDPAWPVPQVPGNWNDG